MKIEVRKEGGVKGRRKPESFERVPSFALYVLQGSTQSHMNAQQFNECTQMWHQRNRGDSKRSSTGGQCARWSARCDRQPRDTFICMHGAQIWRIRPLRGLRRGNHNNRCYIFLYAIIDTTRFKKDIESNRFLDINDIVRIYVLGKLWIQKTYA